MKTYVFPSIFLICVISIQCNNTSKSIGMTSGQLASNICQCAEPLISFNEDLKLLSEQSDNTALMTRMVDGDQIMSRTIDCVTDKLENDISHLINEELNTIISELCQLDSRMTKDILDKVSTFSILQ